ncbi:hypothetical protein C1H46_014449 [Malus baccata]|uniref:Uncharacterized protein n=1 Tax=Malus baccata TaxID=106549 RepID=A0A540MMA7_MALBA|nr:hypothetical protein C1H46_014449 [Malus baccata]
MEKHIPFAGILSNKAGENPGEAAGRRAAAEGDLAGGELIRDLAGGELIGALASGELSGVDSGGETVAVCGVDVAVTGDVEGSVVSLAGDVSWSLFANLAELDARVAGGELVGHVDLGVELIDTRPRKRHHG